MLLSAKTGRVREATPLRRLSHKFEEMKNRVIIHRLRKMNGHWEKSLIYIVPISHVSSGNYCIKKVPRRI